MEGNIHHPLFNVRKCQRTIRSSKGAVDLASIMVGLVVIGIIGGVIAATVFAVIPWAQDQAAKASLRAVVTAQAAYAGFTASGQTAASLTESVSSDLVHASFIDAYTDYETLVSEGLIPYSESLCVEANNDGLNYSAAVVSDSGNAFYLTDQVSEPEAVADGQNTCFGTWDAGLREFLQPTVMSLNCDVTTVVTLPFRGFAGTYEWSDGESGEVAAGAPTAANIPAKSLNAGTTYTVTLDGTFASASQVNNASQACVVSVDQWNMYAGLTSTADMFVNASKLVSVAEPPNTVTNMSGMFNDASSFNQDISGWDVSNVTNMSYMFMNADSFNQNLSSWDVSNVTTMLYMFNGAAVFNNLGDSGINNWDVSNVVNMAAMFQTALAFNQDISGWDVSNVVSMDRMFRSASSFNQDISGWDVSNALSMSRMFEQATVFNRNISGWDVTNVTLWTNFRNLSGLTTPNTPLKFR